MASILRRQSYFIAQNCNNFLHRVVCRTLLSNTDLKLEGFLRQRIFKIDELGHDKKALLICKLKVVKTPQDARNEAASIADLIHVAETEEELSELERLFRLISLIDVSDLENFSFSSTLIRLYHHLGLSDRIYRLYKDPVFSTQFSNNTCHKVLMDLLFKHRQYDLVLDVYTGLQRFNIDCVTLALGAHYHINTPESAEAARNMIRVLMQQYYLSRRALMYAAMLFLKQNLPHVALETLKHCREGTLVFNLQLMCYAKLGQIQDVLKGLDETVERANIITKPLNIRLYSDTMCEIRQAMAKCDNQRSVQKFDFLEKDLSGLGVFSLQTASVLLDKTIHGERHRLKESGKRKVVRVD